MTELAPMRAALLAWYDEHQREMPWRTHPGPYRTWVSEVMLQQTRVEAVREKYGRFLERFPTLEALASAELDEVLAAWSGLGYYRRARFLHAGARHVVEELGGELPRERRALEKVPGIGQYTAGAILSIAFELPEALVDGNVERVLTRRFALAGDPKKGALKKRLWELCGALVHGERPGDWNQALMELGATVCTPRAPRCEACPWAEECAAAIAGEVERYPQLAPRKKARDEKLAAAVVRHAAGVLFLRRGEHESLMPGLWELPTVPGEGDVSGALARCIRERTGLETQVASSVGSVRHGILDRRIELAAHPATVSRATGPTEGSDWAFVAPGDVGELGVSSMYAKVLRRFVERDDGATTDE